MIITSDAPPRKWTSVEAKILRDFLNSDTGQLALEWAAYKAPELLDGTHKNKTLVAGGEVKGYQNALAALWNLTIEQPVEATNPENYPDLDDPTQWVETDTNNSQTNPT